MLEKGNWEELHSKKWEFPPWQISTMSLPGGEGETTGESKSVWDIKQLKVVVLLILK